MTIFVYKIFRTMCLKVLTVFTTGFTTPLLYLEPSCASSFSFLQSLFDKKKLEKLRTSKKMAASGWGYYSKTNPVQEGAKALENNGRTRYYQDQEEYEQRVHLLDDDVRSFGHGPNTITDHHSYATRGSSNPLFEQVSFFLNFV